MFSPSIQNFMNQSSAASAQKRVAQIESIIAQRTDAIRSVAPPEPNAKAFSDFMKVKPANEPKFKLAEPKKITKGEIQNIVQDVASQCGVEEKLIMSVIKQESNFDSNAVSKAGAEGLMQLMPATAKKMGISNSFNPAQNINGGTRYLKSLIEKYNGNLVLALAAYNAGPTNVDKYDGVPPFKETQDYVKKVLSNYLG